MRPARGAWRARRARRRAGTAMAPRLTMTSRRTTSSWPTAREVVGRGCLLAIWMTAETLVQIERIAFRLAGDETDP
jgi:hypothetical protein